MENSIGAGIFEDDDICVEEADEHHECFPCFAGLDVIYFFIEMGLERVNDIEARFFASESVLHMMGGHVEALKLVKLFDEASGVCYEIIGQ